VVATSSLDLGIDWGDVDLVIQMGAPKGVSRLMQRIGRANHRLDEPSRAMIAPANRFEVLESLGGARGVEARELDGDPPRPPCLDVLAQHIVGTPAPSRSIATPLREVLTTQPYRELPRKDFDDTFDFVATGGYALAAYERWHRLKQLPDGRWMLASPLVARQFRMNVGTIVELPLIKVKLRRGPILGEVEEAFIQGLVPGDTFVFAGRLLRFEGVKELHRPVLARDRRRSQGAGLWRRPPAALDLPGRAGARHPAGSVAPSQAAARGARMAARAAHPLDPAGQQPPADRGLSRAAPSSSSSPTASRAGTRTRRLACC
jgi:ATP-dependent Lhr-like helicase